MSLTGTGESIFAPPPLPLRNISDDEEEDFDPEDEDAEEEDEEDEEEPPRCTFALALASISATLLSLSLLALLRDARMDETDDGLLGLASSLLLLLLLYWDNCGRIACLLGVRAAMPSASLLLDALMGRPVVDDLKDLRMSSTVFLTLLLASACITTSDCSLKKSSIRRASVDILWMRRTMLPDD